MKKALSDLWEAAGIFSRNNCMTSAAAVSFYAFFSLIPIMLLITAALGFILGSQSGLLDSVVGMVKQTLPYLSDRIIGDLKGLSRTWKASGWLGLISLVWSAELVLSAASDALTGVFGSATRWGFVRQRVVNLAVLLLGVLAALLSIAMTAAAILFRKVEINFLGLGILYDLVTSLAFKYVLPFFMMTLIVALVYKILSGAKLGFRHALYGSAVFTVLWEMAKHLFAWYIESFPAYNKVYGSLGTLMVLLLWIFYSANIFLFCACYARAVSVGGKKSGKPRINKRK